MRFETLLAIMGLILWLIVDFYILLTAAIRIKRLRSQAIGTISGLSFIAFVSLVTGYVLSMQDNNQQHSIEMMWLFFTFTTLLLSGLCYVVLDILACIPKLWRHKRIKALSTAGVILAIFVFGVMWWGALINRNRIVVNNLTIESREIPTNFDGYRIAQISDLHSGTWGNDTTFMSRLVAKVNDIKPDLIVFTGDIVSRQAKEFAPMVSTFAQLHAPDGVLCITGNHDYGDYHKWATEQEHLADRQLLKDLYDKTGHQLLLNQSRLITRQNDTIVVIGVENIGKPPFASYGDLDKAYPTLTDSLTKILLSHNPDHWSRDIKDNPHMNILLTLSGHTHAMQFQIAGFTPARWAYKTPWGLYTDTLGHNLYVNRGAGTVGMPMRIGATPEITLITLTKK